MALPMLLPDHSSRHLAGRASNIRKAASGQPLLSVESSFSGGFLGDTGKSKIQGDVDCWETFLKIRNTLQALILPLVFKHMVFPS